MNKDYLSRLAELPMADSIGIRLPREAIVFHAAMNTDQSTPYEARHACGRECAKTSIPLERKGSANLSQNTLLGNHVQGLAKEDDRELQESPVIAAYAAVAQAG